MIRPSDCIVKLSAARFWIVEETNVCAVSAYQIGARSR
jgi:hypothetical protein